MISKVWSGVERVVEHCKHCSSHWQWHYEFESLRFLIHQSHLRARSPLIRTSLLPGPLGRRLREDLQKLFERQPASLPWNVQKVYLSRRHKLLWQGPEVMTISRSQHLIFRIHASFSGNNLKSRTSNSAPKVNVLLHHHPLIKGSVRFWWSVVYL